MTLSLALLALAAQSAWPAKPADGRFIADDAFIISDADTEAIRALCGEALAKKNIAIMIATMDRLPLQHGESEDMETAARRLFDRWGIGSRGWNYGVLLLVAKGDRKARIELGASWNGERDRECRQIMDELILPDFKKGLFSIGIREGVKGLQAMALERPVPRAPWYRRLKFNWWWALPAFFLFLITREAAQQQQVPGCIGFGCAWITACFTIWFSGSGSSNSWGGSFGGGGGGGFGGGGGASGSW